MSTRFDVNPLLTATVFGVPSLGVLAEDIPSGGDAGPGLAYDLLSFPADNGKEVRILITRWPVNGTLYVNEDTSFTYSGTTDYCEFDFYLDGVLQSSANRADFIVGEIAITSNTPPRVSLTGYQASVITDVIITSNTPPRISLNTYQATVTLTGSIDIVSNTPPRISLNTYPANVDLPLDIVSNTPPRISLNTYQGIVSVSAVDINITSNEPPRILMTTYRGAVSFGVTTPSGRVYNVAIEDRTFIVGADNEIS